MLYQADPCFMSYKDMGYALVYAIRGTLPKAMDALCSTASVRLDRHLEAFHDPYLKPVAADQRHCVQTQ